jgi:hypothetical protein
VICKLRKVELSKQFFLSFFNSFLFLQREHQVLQNIKFLHFFLALFSSRKSGLTAVLFFQLSCQKLKNSIWHEIVMLPTIHCLRFFYGVTIFFQAKIPNGSKIVIQPYKEIAENLSVYENRYDQWTFFKRFYLSSFDTVKELS